MINVLFTTYHWIIHHALALPLTHWHGHVLTYKERHAAVWRRRCLTHSPTPIVPRALHARTSQQASSCRHLALPERPEAPAGLQPTCPRPQCSLSPAALARSKRYQSNGRPTRRSRPAHASLPVSPPGPACHFQALLPSLSTPAQRLEMRPVLARRLGARSERRGLQLTAAAGARARRSRHGQRPTWCRRHAATNARCSRITRPSARALT